jgi:secreted trypsin-like serine protease
MVGGASIVGRTGAGAHIVMIIGTRGNICTGTALAPDLVLTAGHCVAPVATYRVLLDKPPGMAIHSIAVHPRYSPKDYASGRVTADVALLKLERPLPADIVPARLAPNTAVKPGDRFIVAGFGVTLAHSDNGVGTARQAALVATGRPGNLQIRLVDPATRDRRRGLGACIGDSGGPAFTVRGGIHAVIGVVSWSTGPALSDGCGGLTGVTPLELYRGWVIEQATKFGSPLARKPTSILQSCRHGRRAYSLVLVSPSPRHERAFGAAASKAA